MNFLVRNILSHVAIGAGVYLASKGLDAAINYLKTPEVKDKTDELKANINETVQKMQNAVETTCERVHEEVKDKVDETLNIFMDKAAKGEEKDSSTCANKTEQGCGCKSDKVEVSVETEDNARVKVIRINDEE